MPALMDSSPTRTTSSSTTSRSSSTWGIGQRPATPSAIVSMRSVWTTAPCRHDSAIAGAPSVFDVVALDPYGGAEGGDLTQLERVRGPRRDDRDLEASTGAALGERLPEIPGARTHEARRALRPGHGRHGLRAASLEAPHRVERPDLQRHGTPERLAERRASERRCIEEHWIDLAHGSANAIEPEPDAVGPHGWITVTPAGEASLIAARAPGASSRAIRDVRSSPGRSCPPSTRASISA